MWRTGPTKKLGSEGKLGSGSILSCSGNSEVCSRGNPGCDPSDKVLSDADEEREPSPSPSLFALPLLHRGVFPQRFLKMSCNGARDYQKNTICSCIADKDSIEKTHMYIYSLI